MKCELFFYYNKNDEWNTILKKINNFSSNYKIITTSRELNHYLKENGKNSFILDNLVPLQGLKAFEIYETTKNILESYRRSFKEIEINGIEIFRGFDYGFLRQLEFVMRIKKILEQKKEDIIFIFENYRDSYYSIIKTAEELGYNTKLGISFVKSKEIKFLKIGMNNEEIFNENQFKRVKTINFLKSSFHGKSYTDKIKLSLNFGKKAFYFGINNLFEKSKTNEKNIEYTMKKIKNQLNQQKNPQCIFLITGTREDLFFISLEKIIEKFNAKNIPFQIITTDLATSIVLEKRKINFINLFGEFNTSLKKYKNSQEGKEFLHKIVDIINKNKKLLGINEFREYLIDQIFRSYVITKICEQIFYENELKSICTIADGEILENISVEFAKKNNIPNITMLPGIFVKLPYFLDWFHSQKICVGGTKDKQSMIELGYDEERIIVTGNPRYDFFKLLNTEKSKKSLESNYNLDSTKKLILIARSIWQQNDEIWISKLIKFANKNNFEIAIKIHPRYKIRSQKLNKEKIKFIENSCKKFNFLITYDENFYNLLSASDIVILQSEGTTVEVDVSLANKPMLAIDFSSSGVDSLYSLNDVGASIKIKNYFDLEKNILDILNNKKYLQELEIGRKKISEMYNYKNDGNAANRIFEILTKQN
jgi:hypothetical protein